MAKRSAPSPDEGSVPAKRGPTKDASTDADAENTENLGMLGLGQSLETSSTDDKEVQQLRIKVTADRKKLKALLHQRSQQAEEAEAHRRNEVAAIIFDALKIQKRSTPNDVPKFTGTRIATNSAYTSVTEVFTASETLLDEYARLDKKIADMGSEQAGPLGDTWHQELQEAERQLQMGARVAVRNVKKVLGAVLDGDGKDTDLTRDSEMQKAEGDGLELKYELQRSLRYAERGVKRMVKGLPEEDNV
ncbi:hypothetical protein DE146DRAFT_695529 [Phaeosphaeria sp. MPI-PUGE-AT-0046c]|nr:hypothetical protein DE146DRAFT_695529 [Phaeosphaeria sp. MPI-PUGE-AT-0046c]